ncbi:hypothetical protein FDP41_006271 [Naegleria fowleri]|uniref:VPS37 C-terminal domain-containing protein n=1 Tax=Naegleria fowleri TaxID=5763 RepID=A0A6A5BCI8_NAEFO|nr:uncharacterized protein FDP41_006271 [Naegleria fowleri]KAF0974797.1 hypothetical protein FDP41_006271 [Naegleria fowleri]CAG4715951.1 unnamed protein product [Naegleria fowleri]
MYANNNNNSFYGGYSHPPQQQPPNNMMIGGYNNIPPTTTPPPNNMMNSSFSNLKASPFYTSNPSPVMMNGVMASSNTASLEQQQAQRTRQLQADSVIKRFHNAKIVSTNDNNVVDVPITLKNGQQLTFRILMQHAFPQQPPLITTLATIKHQNIDNNGYVVHQQLRQWTPQSSLGDVLSLVFRDFITNPPIIVSLDEWPKNHITKVTSNNGTPSITPPPPSSSSPSVGVYHQPQTFGTNTIPTTNAIPPSLSNPPISSVQTPIQDSSCSIRLPPVPTSFPEISLLEGTEAIQKLLDNQEAFEQFVENLAFTRESKNIYQDLRNANMEIAKRNVSKDEQLNITKESIDQKKVEVDKILEQVQMLQAKQQQLSQRYAPPQLLVLLNEKIEQSDAESEELGEAFLNSREVADSQQIKQFIDKYIEKRSLYYLRKQKRDRFRDTYCKQ